MRERERDRQTERRRDKETDRETDIVRKNNKNRINACPFTEVKPYKFD